MAIDILQIPATRRALRKFVKFGISLYEGNPYYVPPLIMDDVNTLMPTKNPAFEYCEAQSFMAYKNGKAAGRITAIINHRVNARSGSSDMRFGYLDFIDDDEVVNALFEAAARWGKERGMTAMVGPMGFTDMDHEGMLIDGFDEVGTMATIYNYPYYVRQIERLGFVKDADWLEFRMTIPDRVPDKYARIARIVAEKYGLRTLKFTSRKKLRSQYGHALFELINTAYDKLYGYSPLSPKQIDYYIDMYLGILRLDDISVVVDNDDKLVGVGISITSFSRALQRCRGRIFPFGWWHLLKPLRGKSDTVDLLLVAVSPEYLNKGVNSLIFCDLLPVYMRSGYKYAESNPEYEANGSVQKQWEYFEHRQHRRRRAYRRDI